MAVHIRLARRGTTNRPFYHIVAADSRCQRDGRFLERLGVYDPLGETQLAVDEDRIKKWVARGAQSSVRAKTLLKRAGVQA